MLGSKSILSATRSVQGIESSGQFGPAQHNTSGESSPPLILLLAAVVVVDSIETPVVVANVVVSSVTTTGSVANVVVYL